MATASGVTAGEEERNEFGSLRAVDPAMKESVVVVVGKPKSGKSTALSNIFHLDLESGASPQPATHLPAEKHRVKRRNGRDILVFDTRSLGQLKFENTETGKEWRSRLGNGDFTLVYCLPVAPNSCITNEDRSIVNLIHWFFGYGVWNKCVLLLTFSDTAKRELFSSDEDSEAYKKHLKAHAEAFHSLLIDCGAVVRKSFVIFDYGNRGQLEKLVVRNLVAVPAGKIRQDSSVDIIPGLSDDGRQWPDYAFHEIQKKSCKRQIRAFSFFYHFVQVVGTFSACTVLGIFSGYQITPFLLLAVPVVGLGVLKKTESAASSVDIKIDTRFVMMVLCCFTFCGYGLYYTLGSALRSLWCGSTMVANDRELLCTHRFRRLDNYFIQKKYTF